MQWILYVVLWYNKKNLFYLDKKHMCNHALACESLFFFNIIAWDRNKLLRST